MNMRVYELCGQSDPRMPGHIPNGFCVCGHVQMPNGTTQSRMVVLTGTELAARGIDTNQFPNGWGRVQGAMPNIALP